MKNFIIKTFAWILGLGAAAAISGVALFLIVFTTVYNKLPNIDVLTDYKPKVPLRIYSADNKLIGEFGEERRSIVKLSETPAILKAAVLSAEDNQFYEHSGIVLSGIARAAITNILTGRKGQGGSTITMQVARNFFLSSERTYTRKITEIALAYKIERTLTKDQIFEIYLNHIYLGQRAYGFASAAQIYFHKNLEELTIAEAATLAGLPVAPSTYNPAINQTRSTMRKNYVLGRMRALGYITEEQYQEELKRPVYAKKQADRKLANKVRESTQTIHAEYAAELARMLVYDVFKDDTYTRGLNVYTTIQSTDQEAAWKAVRSQLIGYDRKYGYRGPLKVIDISDPKTRQAVIASALASVPSSPNLLPAVITEITPKSIRVSMGRDSIVQLDDASLKFAQTYLKKKIPAKSAVQKLPLVPGALVRVSLTPKNAWTLAQDPQVQAGFISVDFESGAVRSLVGGFDFYLNMFNHVTQALRQPGSSFKPFVYSAALDKGFNPGTVVNDAPIFIDPRLTGGQLWEPHNYDGRFDGPMTLATALKKSKNLVSIRIMQAIGAQYCQEYATKFGFDPSRTPAQLTTALGAGTTTPWEMAGAYCVFANGGYRVKPYLIDKVTDPDGKVLMQVSNPKAGDESIRAIDDRNAFLMHSLLAGVVREGTGFRAYRTLKRQDMGGKTGTSNNANDAWFAGYAGNLVAIGWMGYDQMRPLGSRETGGGLVLPIWVDYMQAVLKNKPDYPRVQPKSVALVNGTYYYADNIDQSVREVPMDGQIQEKNREHDILRDQIF